MKHPGIERVPSGQANTSRRLSGCWREYFSLLFFLSELKEVERDGGRSGPRKIEAKCVQREADERTVGRKRESDRALLVF